MKDKFMKNGVFSLEYDKETLKDMVLKLQEKNKQLQERIEYLERSNNRREVTIFEQNQKIIDLEDNWDMIKEYIGTEWYCFDNESVEFKIAKDILDKMQELENETANNCNDCKQCKGSDSND